MILTPTTVERAQITAERAKPTVDRAQIPAERAEPTIERAKTA
ncbi:UNVERIFIED_CONTAM: hypothetical protein DES50_101957 [Williamsia faeni]